MVIKGGARSSPGELAFHLLRADSNQLVNVRGLDGVASSDLRGAILEMAAVGAGARSRKPLYHASINTARDEVLSEAQQGRAIDRLAEELGLTGQPRAVVEHVKAGRAHVHVVWSRIDGDTLTAIRDSHNYRKHETVARDLEREFEHARVQGAHIERDGIDRPARTPEPHEMMQAARSGLTPAKARAEITALWHQADSGRAFADALDDAGWTLARGDKRDFVVVDRYGESHSLGRRVEGVKAAAVRERMADVDAAGLLSVDQARQAVRNHLPVPVPELGGIDLPAPSPEAPQRASYKVELTPPADLDDRFGPTPQNDPDAGMTIDNTPAPAELDELGRLAARQAENIAQRDRERAGLEAELRPLHRDADLNFVPTLEGVRRRDASADAGRGSSMDGAARRAMEDLARVDPVGMAARHGFHAGDRLKTPEEMRQEWADRMRSFRPPEPEPVPTPEMGGIDLPAPSPEAPQRAPYEVEADPRPSERSRFAAIIAAARERLNKLADRLEVAFGRVRDQVKPEAAARPTPEKGRGMDDNGAVILEAMKQPEPEPRRTARTMADELLNAVRDPTRKKQPQLEPTPEVQRSIWDDFKRRQMRRPGEGFEP